MRALCIAAIAMVLVSLPGGAVRAADPADSLHGLIAEYDRYHLADDPVAAGQQGNLAAQGRWPDPSPAADARRKTALTGFRTRLEAIPPAALGETDALDRDFLLWEIGTGLDSLRFDEARLAFQADDGFFNLPDYVARGTVVRSPAEAAAWLDRLTALPAWYTAETENARRGLESGFGQNDVVTMAALRSAKAAADEPIEQSSLLLPFAGLPDSFTPDERTRLQARARAIVADRVRPAQIALVRFLAEVYLPRARRTTGFGAVPDGAAYYAFTVRRHTTTGLSPAEIHRIGLDEVARIRGEMDQVIAQTGFKGSFAAFQASLRSDPRFYAVSRSALLEKASEIAKRIDGELPKWFGLLPRLTYGVRPVPAAIEESYTSARYWPGSPEQGVAGGFMVNTSHLDQRPLYELPALALHEAVPGHHLQIALAQENREIPQFRRDAELTAFVEGWALYAEKLGGGMGIYRDPYERFGQLSMEMWRACRLVIDTGLHAEGWSRDQAVHYLADNTALSAKNVEVEVDRYIGWPGQALGYKIGELRLLALRHQAETVLGPRFDIRRFHDFVLGAGPLPLALLETRVAAWIQRLKS